MTRATGHRPRIFRVVLPYAVFAVDVCDGEVVAAAPIAKWMVGKRWDICERWVLGKGGTREELHV